MWRFLVRVSQGGKLYGRLINIVIGILLGILVVDSLFCAFDQIYVDEIDLKYAFLSFTYLLTLFGVLLTLAWFILYFMLRKEINSLPQEIRNTISTKVRYSIYHGLDEPFLCSDVGNNGHTYPLLHFGGPELRLRAE